MKITQSTKTTFPETDYRDEVVFSPDRDHPDRFNVFVRDGNPYHTMMLTMYLHEEEAQQLADLIETADARNAARTQGE